MISIFTQEVIIIDLCCFIYTHTAYKNLFLLVYVVLNVVHGFVLSILHIYKYTCIVLFIINVNQFNFYNCYHQILFIQFKFYGYF